MWRLLLSTEKFSMGEESSMRTLTLALTAGLALTAVTAFTARGMLVGSTEPGAPTDSILKHRSGGLGGNPQEGGFLRGGERFAKGDMTGTGGGGMMGNHRGDMMGNMGKQ
jgi:hypothetical protein